MASVDGRPVRIRDRAWRRAGILLASAWIVSGCALLGASVGPTASPRAAPARWQARFCEAQEWVAVARVRMAQARTRLDPALGREVLEDLGDDAADTASRALDFLAVVPDWAPARALVRSERTMLEQAVSAGDRLEELALRGPVDAADLRPIRVAMDGVGEAMMAAARAARDAESQGIPCAIPRLAPLVPPGVQAG